MGVESSGSQSLSGKPVFQLNTWLPVCLASVCTAWGVCLQTGPRNVLGGPAVDHTTTTTSATAPPGAAAAARVATGLEAWRGRVAVVTGASSGIGWAVCEALGRAGLRVVAVARRR